MSNTFEPDGGGQTPWDTHQQRIKEQTTICNCVGWDSFEAKIKLLGGYTSAFSATRLYAAIAWHCASLLTEGLFAIACSIQNRFPLTEQQNFLNRQQYEELCRKAHEQSTDPPPEVPE